MTFNQFTTYYEMFKIYKFQGKQFCSTSHLGRLMSKGFLVFIFDAHKSSYSWNGKFKADDMFVELEVVDGFVGDINCFITSTPNEAYRKNHGIADLDTFVQILFPHYRGQGFQDPLWYIECFEDDIDGMPDSDDPPEKFNMFHKYMINHFFGKAPLVRLTLVSSVYSTCDSEILHTDLSNPKPRYAPLDVEIPLDIRWLDPSKFLDPFKQVFQWGRIATHVRTSNWTYWDLVELGRHSREHLMDKTLVLFIDNIVQT